MITLSEQKNENRIADSEERTMPEGQYIVCGYDAENFEILVSEALYKANAGICMMSGFKRGMIPEPILMQKYFSLSRMTAVYWCEAKIKE